MPYYNKSPSKLSELFLGALCYTGKLVVFLGASLILLLVLCLTDVATDKIVNTAMFTGVIILCVLLLEIFYMMLWFLPKEKSVTIDRDSLTIVYPYFKKRRNIPFRDIVSIKVNQLNSKNESVLTIKSDQIDSMIGEDWITIHSIAPSEWKEIALSKGLPLILSIEIEEKVITKWGVLFPNTLGDDGYIIQRDFQNNELKISDRLFLAYVSTNSSLTFLGVEELINVHDQIPSLHCSIKTNYGLKPLYFFDGKLSVDYEQGKSPTEIEQIALDLKAQYKSVEDIITAGNI